MLKHPEVKSLFGNSKGLTFVSTGVVNAVNGKLVETQSEKKMTNQMMMHVGKDSEKKSLYEQIEDNNLRQEELYKKQLNQQKAITQEEYLDLKQLHEQQQAKQREIHEMMARELASCMEDQKKLEMKMKSEPCKPIDFSNAEKSKSLPSKLKIIKKVKPKKETEIKKAKPVTPESTPLNTLLCAYNSSDSD